jgi:hypothetical protein
MKKRITLTCGLEMNVEINQFGAILIDVGNNGSISTRDNTDPYVHFPDSTHIVISPSNIPVFKKLIKDIEAYQRKRKARK